MTLTPLLFVLEVIAVVVGAAGLGSLVVLFIQEYALRRSSYREHR